VRGKLKDIAIFEEQWWGRQVCRCYYPAQPKTGRQQGEQWLFYSASQNWKGFDQNTKNYYNEWARGRQRNGYDRYIELYLRANYPMIIYWGNLEKDASDNVSPDAYMSSDRFQGVQRVLSLSEYPASPPYGTIVYKSDIKKFMGFKEDEGWDVLG
jgi:hypothetical protein